MPLQKIKIWITFDSNDKVKLERLETMKTVKAKEKNLEKLLSETMLGVDYYQREYKWGASQVDELIKDLHEEFLKTWNPSNPCMPCNDKSLYFLGSIVVIKSNNTRYIVDGQQRIITILLILIYLENYLKSTPHKIDFKIKSMIYSEDQGNNKYWLDVADRNECMEALLLDQEYNTEGKSESIKNMINCYENIKIIFSSLEFNDVCTNKFSWWIINNVNVVEITVTDDRDAYTIFETMNDRGLRLSPTDMLRGYLLSNIENEGERIDTDKKIGNYIGQFKKYGEDIDVDFFRTWLRSQYAQAIRGSKKDAKPEDFDNLSPEYHRWVRDNKERILADTRSIYNFANRDLSFFSEVYLTLLHASTHLIDNMRSVKFNNDINFTLQHHLIMAGISPHDSPDVITEKICIISDFIDIWLNLRLWNQKSNRYDILKYPTFRYITQIRRQPSNKIRYILRDILDELMKENNFSEPVILTQRSRKNVRFQLARIIDWLEREAGIPGGYELYTSGAEGQPPYNIEHIWHNDHTRFSHEDLSSENFNSYRNKIGGLLLIPRNVNRSLSDKSYEEKLDTYGRENILASSLHRSFYNNNHSFFRAMKRRNISFEFHDNFTKNEIDSRSSLCCDIAKLVWSPNRVLKK